MAPSHDPAAVQPALVAGRLDRLKRLFRGKRKFAWLGGGLLLAVVPALLLMTGGHEGPHQEPLVHGPVTLARTLSALHNADTRLAYRLARQLPAANPHQIESYSASEMVLGILALRAAKGSDVERKRELVQLAIRHLQAAHQHGFPETHQTEGLLALARAYLADRRAAEALPIVREALATASSPTDVAQCHRLLAQALAGLPNPDYPAAVEQMLVCLAAGDCDEPQRLEDELALCELSARMGDFESRGALLDKLLGKMPNSNPVRLLQARRLLSEASRGLGPDEPRLAAATALLRDVEAADLFRTEASPQAGYLLAQVLVAEQKPAEAIEQFQRLARLFPESDEAVLAELHAGELQLTRGALADAVRALARAARLAGQRQPFANRWIAQEQLRQRLKRTMTALAEGEHFDLAIELVRRLPPLIPQAESLRKTAELYETWAESLAAKSTGDEPSAVAELREKHAAAGAAWAQLAHAAFTTREFPELLWRSAVAYLNARNHAAAARMLRQYLEYEELGRNVPEALCALGKCHYERGEFAECLKALQTCIDDHPEHPVAAEARLYLAKARLELNQFVEAEAALRENLEASHITPASEGWRESLFDLGHLMYLQARWADAVRIWDEALQRAPASPSAPRARYLLADAARLLAREQQRKAEAADDEASCRRHAEQARLLRELALRHVEAVLAQSTPAAGHDPASWRALRHACELARPVLLVELGRDEDAAEAYFAAIGGFSDQPAVLDACVQAAAVYRRLNRPDQARQAIQYARRMLARLPETADFSHTSQASRAAWSAFLDWLESA